MEEKSPHPSLHQDGLPGLYAISKQVKPALDIQVAGAIVDFRYIDYRAQYA